MYRKTIRLGVLTAFISGTLLTSGILGDESEVTTRLKTVQNSNAAILQRLGLVPLRIPDGHYKKRLSGPEPSDVMEIGLGATDTRMHHQPYSRRHGHRDSHIYVVKLPPSQPYYTLTKPHAKVSNSTDKGLERNPGGKKTSAAGNSSPQVDFQSNGKPAKIYHWNLPLVKKITEKKRFHAQMKIDQMRKRLEAEMKDNRLLTENNVRPTEKNNASTIGQPKKSPSNGHASNGKRYHHSSANSLNPDEKHVKHSRNNDKRLNYPKTPEAGENPGRYEIGDETRQDKEKTLVNNKNNKKSYRLDDSNLYRLETRNNNAERHKNDRLAVWNLSNELHASMHNAQNLLRPKKHRKKAAMSYYAPINSRSGKIETSTPATNIQNNFSGNGKPKAFYVMEKSRQPVYYHPLLP